MTNERYDVLQEIVKSKEYKEKNAKERQELLISLIRKIDEQEYQSLKGSIIHKKDPKILLSNGYISMPVFGTPMNLSDTKFRSAIDYVIGEDMLYKVKDGELK